MKQIPHWENRSLENITEIFEDVIYIEEWGDIKGYEGIYQVSTFGRVKSFHVRRNGFIKILKQGFNEDGYLICTLCNKTHRLSISAHVLTATKFVPNTENKPEVNHLKGVKTDNRFHQLEWNTKKENIQHAARLGLRHQNGEECRFAYLKEKQVIEIMRSELSCADLMNKYKVSSSTVYQIKNGGTWKHLGLKPNPIKRKITKEDVPYILTCKLTPKQLAEKYNVDSSSICHIRSGRFYKEIFKQVKAQEALT